MYRLFFVITGLLASCMALGASGGSQALVAGSFSPADAALYVVGSSGDAGLALEALMLEAEPACAETASAETASAETASAETAFIADGGEDCHGPANPDGTVTGNGPGAAEHDPDPPGS